MLVQKQTACKEACVRGTCSPIHANTLVRAATAQLCPRRTQQPLTPLRNPWSQYLPVKFHHPVFISRFPATSLSFRNAAEKETGTMSWPGSSPHRIANPGPTLLLGRQGFPPELRCPPGINFHVSRGCPARKTGLTQLTSITRRREAKINYSGAHGGLSV